MEKKKLKKLELKKHVVVELSEDESRQVQGGTTVLCYRIAQLIASVATVGQGTSVWTCAPPPPSPAGVDTDLTCFQIYGGCNIGDINVTP